MGHATSDLLGMKRFLKITLIIVVIAVIFFCLPQLILAYPNFLFGKKHTYKNFIILSDKDVDRGIDAKLDSITDALTHTGFYNGSTIKVILCNKGSLTKFLDKISLAPGGAGFHHFSGNIFLFESRIEQFRKENAKAEGAHKKLIKYSYQEFNFKNLLTHEVLHKLHSDTLGLFEFKRKMPSPHWKAEGFAEYFAFLSERAADPNYDFMGRIELYLKFQHEFPLFYIKSELLYEFLTEHQKMTFAQIMDDSTTEEATFDSLIKWYSENKIKQKSDGVLQ